MIIANGLKLICSSNFLQLTSYKKNTLIRATLTAAEMSDPHTKEVLAFQVGLISGVMFSFLCWTSATRASSVYVPTHLYIPKIQCFKML